MSDRNRFERFEWVMEGGQSKEKMISLLEALLSTIKSEKATYFQFKIRVSE